MEGIETKMKVCSPLFFLKTFVHAVYCVACIFGLQFLFCAWKYSMTWRNLISQSAVKMVAEEKKKCQSFPDELLQVLSKVIKKSQ